MAAKDYHICPGLFNAYIAKVSKRDPNLMLEDRRIITDAEIMNLIEWWVEKQCLKNNGLDVVITRGGDKILTLTPGGKLLENIKNNLRSRIKGQTESNNKG